MFAAKLKRLAVMHPRLTVLSLFLFVMLLVGADPAAAGVHDDHGGALVGFGP